MTERNKNYPKQGAAFDAKSGTSTHKKKPWVDRRVRPDWWHETIAETTSYVYGLNPVLCALSNPERKSLALKATQNGLNRLSDYGIALPKEVSVDIFESKRLDRFVGSEAVHQGLVLEVERLDTVDIKQVLTSQTLVVLDHVTDPHNVGAIMRTAAAFGADALISTSRHSARETAVMAKSAAGALDLLPWVKVTNLAATLETLADAGFHRIGLAEEADSPLKPGLSEQKIALVLGSEGKGLRPRTRALCNDLMAITLSGSMKSLNVSNAAAIALFAVTEAQKARQN